MGVDLDVLDDLARKAGLHEWDRKILRRGVEQDRDDLRRTALGDLGRTYLPIDVPTALRLIGKDHEVRPEDVWACVHTDLAVADLFACLNEHCYGHSILGRAPVDGGDLVVIDLRPAISRLRAKAMA